LWQKGAQNLTSHVPLHWNFTIAWVFSITARYVRVKPELLGREEHGWKDFSM
jgi:hypothetical protein